MVFADINNSNNWSVNRGGDFVERATSATSGHKTVVDGVDDLTATFTHEPGGATPEVAVGTNYTWKFFEDGTLNWTGTAIVESLSFEISNEDGSPTTYTFTLGATGAWTDATGAGSAAFTSVNGKVQWEAIA